MTQRQFAIALKWTILIGILSTLFAQFFVYSGFFFPYIFTKTIFFRIIIEIVLFAYLFLVAIDPSYRFKSSKISWAIFAYIGIVILTSIVGVNFSRSFFGTVERSEGVITMLHIVALFVVSYSVFKEKKDWLLVFDVAFFAGLLQGGYSLLQKLDVKTFLGIQVLNAGGRVQGSIGNASFLAGLLILTIFIGSLLFWDKKSLNWRIYYGAGLLFLLYILYCSQVRGAVLGLLGGGFLFTILAVFFSKNKKLKLGLVSGVLIVIIFSIVIWNCREQKWVKEAGTLNRLTSISLSDVSTQSRLLGWQGAIKGWTETPKAFLFGYGYENYNIPFNKYFNPKIFIDAGSQLWFDRAHNIIFEVALTSGIIGLAAYLSIFIAVIWSLYQLYKKNRENLYLYLLLVSGLAAYFAQNLFVFDTLPTYILFYLILAYIAFLYSTDNLPEMEEVKKKDKIDIGIFGSALLLIMLYLIAYSINIRPAQANYNINQAFRYAHYGNDANSNFEKIHRSFDQLVKEGNKTPEEITDLKRYWGERARERYKEAVYYFDKSISYGTYQNREFREKYIESVLTFFRFKSLEGYEDIIDNYLGKILAEADKNVEEFPGDIQEYLYAMTAYNMSVDYNPSKVELIYQLAEKAIELSPTRPQIFYELGKAKISEKKFDEAIDYFEKAVALNPEPIESHWNLLIAYVQAGEAEKADFELEEMQRLGMGISLEKSKDLNRLISIFLGVENYEKVAWLYDHLIVLQSLTVDHYVKAAIVNKEIGEYTKARQYMKKAIELDETMIPEAQAFLESME